MASLSRFFTPLLYRPHLENGFSAAFGVTLVGLAVGLWLGLAAGIAAATGALCVSIADQPDPLSEKPQAIAAAVAMAVTATGLTLLAKPHMWSLFLAIAGMGMWAGLISAYGKRAVGLGVVTVLASVLALGADIDSRDAIILHVELFSAGAVLYGIYAVGGAWLFENRVRRLLMAEALRSFGAYLRTKAQVFDPDTDNAKTFAAMIEAHASAVERMQIARNAIYAHTKRDWQQRQARSLVALLDAFETILSSDADLEILQASQHRHLMRRLRALTLLLADDVERLALEPAAVVEIEPHRAEREAIAKEIARIMPQAAGNDEERQAIAAFRSTADKLGQSAVRIASIGARKQEPPRSDLALFRAVNPTGWSHLRAQIGFGVPAFRYAIRLTLAMTTGLALTVFFPRFAHVSWILLTTALIMRANYSVTRQRRWDRIIGTLAGCVLAAALQTFVPIGYLLALVAICTGVSHAFGAVNYRVTAASASVSALLLLHFLQPHAQHVLSERVIDTLIGAALSYVFGFLLPTWERHDLPKTIQTLLKADREFAAEAMTRQRVEQAYRLARKRLFDAVAAFSGAIRRIADEPGTPKDVLARLNALLAANYLLLSDLTSMQVLYHMRGAELDKVANADALAGEMRTRVVTILTPDGPPDKAPPRLSKGGMDDLFQPNASSTLKRRLVHIEHAARRVVHLASAART
ncbi:MAG: FUSC family protein [Alphaproteobacteria bacterium]|nr:FUSC family protein [Alphaproteobacteria bacterium]MBL6939529.1 FUSC family protein [Alphaproteobacteria bacterium]MBL7100097.1 FUSC family protein [Alphaproteobacteria bacterium]